MINPEKLQNALYALHGVLVKARAVACTSENNEEVIAILSRAEVLITMLGNDADETVAFRKMLERDATPDKWNFVLNRFDASKPWETI